MNSATTNFTIQGDVIDVIPCTNNRIGHNGTRNNRYNQGGLKIRNSTLSSSLSCFFYMHGVLSFLKLMVPSLTYCN